MAIWFHLEHYTFKIFLIEMYCIVFPLKTLLPKIYLILAHLYIVKNTKKRIKLATIVFHFEIMILTNELYKS